GLGVVMCGGVGRLGGGIEDAADGAGTWRGQAGLGWHQVQVAAGGDRGGGGCRFHGGGGVGSVLGFGRVLGLGGYVFGRGWRDVGLVGVEFDVRRDGRVYGLGDLRRDRRGGFHGGDLLLVFGLFDLAELVVHLHAEFAGGATELVHKLADIAGELGQLLRTEEKQGDEEDDGTVLKAGHVLFVMIRQRAVSSE